MVIRSQMPQGVAAVAATALAALAVTFLLATFLPSTADPRNDALASLRTTSLDVAWLRMRAVTEPRSAAAP